MKINILTSNFLNGFTSEFSYALKKIIKKHENFVLVASEFEQLHEKTDRYFNLFLRMFSDCGMEFANSHIVDGRMTPEEAQKTIASADVLWLSGGNTFAQYGYIETYGLIPVIREHKGVTIGMSAGSINMAKTVIWRNPEHEELKIYQALGLVDISVAPHFGDYPASFLNELLQISHEYPIHGISDDSAIIVEGDKTTYLGDIFLISKGIIKQISQTEILKSPE